MKHVQPLLFPDGWRKKLSEIAYDLRGDSVGAPGVADRFGWLVDALSDALVFDHAPSIDGANPLVGPALALAGGTCGAGRPTLWRTRGGTALTAGRYSATARHSTATALDPADNQDLFVISVVNPHFDVLHVWCGTYNGGRGWHISTQPGGTALLHVQGNAAMQSVAAITPGGWLVLLADIDRSGTQDLYVGSVLGDSDACPAGSFAGAAGIGSNTSGNGGYGAAAGTLLRNMVFHGVSLHERVAAIGIGAIVASITGLTAKQGAPATYARAGRRCYYPAGIGGPVHVLANNVPPAGGQAGIGPDEAIGPLATGKNLPTAAGDAALWTADAGLDAPAVGSHLGVPSYDAQVPDGNGYVIYLKNTTAGTLYYRVGDALGVVTPCWGSIRAYIYAGAPRLGFQTAAGAFTVIGDIQPLYARTYGVASPSAVTDQLAIEMPAGAWVAVCLECADTGGVVADEVAGTGPGATSAQGTMTTGHMPGDASETIELTVTPQTWGTTPPVAAEMLVSRSGGATGLLALDGAGNLTTTDGTNTPSATLAAAEADQRQTVFRAAHGGAPRLYVTEVGGTGAETAYDGALAQSGTLTLPGSRRRVRLRVLRNARLRATP